jgi:DNA-binding MarR family transcriptional regulator
VGKDKPHNLIDEMIHQRTRLSIMATLAGVRALDFSELKAQLGLTDGNLSTHLSTLERAGYVRIDKSFCGRKPRTTVAQTAKGRQALAGYVNVLMDILDRADAAPEPDATAPDQPPQGED